MVFLSKIWQPNRRTFRRPFLSKEAIISKPHLHSLNCHYSFSLSRLFRINLCCFNFRQIVL
ncbi:hypothetical protein NEISUBOT_04093 [Neisseria subflava NJ9703]|uniref:Uncharacterized protein n=1 Tax=Neisseria subflava NJ9703 TaxID=546268 RepID=A0A9W5IRA7_NEISU|nr:hypothetical protein NEISUBOT_04093 [Neisseria subflava NJ9703]